MPEKEFIKKYTLEALEEVKDRFSLEDYTILKSEIILGKTITDKRIQITSKALIQHEKEDTSIKDQQHD